MARIVAAADQQASSTTQTVSATISGSNRLTYLAIKYRQDSVALNTVEYGAGNTIYDSAGDTSRLIFSAQSSSGYRLMVFRVFDGAHPANGLVTVTFKIGRAHV